MSNAEATEKRPDQAQELDVLSTGLRERTQPSTQQRAIAFKVSHILLSLLFLWIFFVHAIGLFLFTKGFLLTRLVLEDKSECDILPNGDSAANIRNGCWHPKTFNKAVVIIIDALRYDFTVPFQPTDTEIEPKYYHNHFPFMYDTASKNPEKAFLFPFIADPPTSTLQRLKGLTAGNLPTFIDIGSNFAGSAAEEDNILVQLKDQKKTIVHLGDDTWHSLFPGYFHENLTHSYDSFNVWDLHTVDNGVIEHIMPLLEKKTNEWDIIFGHFLGVDHAGHRYGPDHPAMAEKLQQMDTVLRDITKRLDDDTVLFVMGDHGMDPKGDHGGESDDEVEATLWVYSNKPRFGRRSQADIQPPLTAKERPVQQIDLVSTLSLLLGLPVPFNNLGTPIPEAFMHHVPADSNDEQNIAAINLLVFDQMKRYQSRYTQSRELEQDGQLRKLHDELDISLRSRLNPEATTSTNLAYEQYHKGTVDMYRKLWANFDLIDMICGVAVLGASLLTLLSTALTTGPDGANDLALMLRNIGLGLIVGLVISIPGFLANPSLTQLTASTGPISLATIASILAAAVTRFTSFVSSVSKIPTQSLWGWLWGFFTVSQAAGFASNSYTIHEDTILLFLLTTFGMVAFISSLRQASQSDRILGIYQSVLFMLLTRASSFSRLCREEQMPGCRSTFYASQTSSTSAPWQILIPFAVALLLPEIIKAFYKGTASYAASAGFWIGFCFRIGLVFVAAHWTIDAADNGDWLADRFSGSTLKTISISMARCALAIAIPVGFSTFFWAKPCIDISLQNPVPSQDSEGTRPQITILGYANTFGSRYFLLIPAFVLSIILLLPPMGQFTLALCTWQILCLLEILDTNGLSINESSQPFIGPVVLAMLGSYYFFKTGHQAVLSSIQWNAAFVPLRTIVYPWSPILIILNNFGPQILCAIAVPLTVLWKRPISKDGLKGLWSDVMNACLAHMLYYATIQLATTMWAGHLRRHLMLYRVFMPRFLMASGVLLVVDLILVVIALTAVRVTGSSVAEIFGY